jgi:hypothetical protein
MSRIEYDPPVRPGLHCRYCGKEVQAVARVTEGLQIKGVNAYDWRHVASNEAGCTLTFNAAVHDDWQATRYIEGALEQRRIRDGAS